MCKEDTYNNHSINFHFKHFSVWEKKQTFGVLKTHIWRVQKNHPNKYGIFNKKNVAQISIVWIT
jgi:hypothetical protein